MKNTFTTTATHCYVNDKLALRFEETHSIYAFLIYFFAGDFEELKDIPTCLCEKNGWTALQGKSSQLSLHLASVSRGETSSNISDNFI